jgi:2,5-diketo-D-gluconate reductase B
LYVTIQGEQLPALGFGTWQLTGDQCRQSVSDALTLGYRHVDTAQAYDNEAEVGQGIRNAGVDRDDIFLTTKIMRNNFTAEAVAEVVPDSFRRLGVDVIDLMLLHWPSEDVPIGETLTALRRFQDKGQIRHLGVSNFSSSLVDEARKHAIIFCNQVVYHPFEEQDELLAQANEYDYLLTAYSPLARGRVTQSQELGDIAETHGKTPAQVTLRWLLQQDNVCAIPKAASEAHRRSNCDIFDFELNREDMVRISRLREQ